MATHTDNGGGARMRRFSIGRENGEKSGKPIFLEWLRELPAEADRKGRKFETRGDATKRHYEVFTALDGILTGVRREKKTILQEEKDLLYIRLDDGEEVYEVEVGTIDSRYAMNLLSRLLNPHFNHSAKIRVSPYAMEKDGKNYIGVGVHNPDKLEAVRRENLPGMPDATSTVFKGQTLWDFMPQAEWLYSKVQSDVLPRLLADAWQAPGPQPQPANTARTAASAGDYPKDTTNHEVVTADDGDLPF